MNRKAGTGTEGEAKKKAEARTALLLAVIFGGLIVIMVGGMLWFDIYAEKVTEAGYKAPADAAER
jgi:hypothetical protein